MRFDETLLKRDKRKRMAKKFAPFKKTPTFVESRTEYFTYRR